MNGYWVKITIKRFHTRNINLDKIWESRNLSNLTKSEKSRNQLNTAINRLILTKLDGNM